MNDARCDVPKVSGLPLRNSWLLHQSCFALNVTEPSQDGVGFGDRWRLHFISFIGF